MSKDKHYWWSCAWSFITGVGTTEAILINKTTLFLLLVIAIGFSVFMAWANYSVATRKESQND
jgi:hypothetical protein